MTTTNGSALKERASKGPGRGCASSCWLKRRERTGIRKAAVLPEPLRIEALISFHNHGLSTLSLSNLTSLGTCHQILATGDNGNGVLLDGEK